MEELVEFDPLTSFEPFGYFRYLIICLLEHYMSKKSILDFYQNIQ